jgi:kynurenine formamidase
MRRSAGSVVARIGVVTTLLGAVGCQAPREPAPDTHRAEIIASVFGGGAGKWVDLTHAFSSRSIYWPTDTLGFQLEKLAHGHTSGGWFYSSYRYAAAEHGGTHLDAPIHFAEGGWTNDQVPLTSLVGPAVVVDVSSRVQADYLVTVEDLTGWEAEHGQMPAGAILLVRTGWDARYQDRAAYLGTSVRGEAAVAQLHFPGVSAEAAQWLVDHRRIAALGIDTPSIDYGQSKDFRAHVILYSKNIPGFENVANLAALPPVGGYVMALPMKIEGGSGGPLRIVGYVP